MDKALGLLWDNAVVYLVSTVGNAFVDSWRERSAIDSYISELRAALPKARRLLERSECWRLPIYDSIDELHSQLKDSIYEAKSLVDEFEYQRLKNEIEMSFPGEFFFKRWMRNFPITVKRVIDRLNEVHNKLKENCDRHGIPENPHQFSQTVRDYRRDTSTFLDTSNVIGRDKELNKVIHLIGVPSSGSDQRKRGKTKSTSKFDIGKSSIETDKKQNVLVLPIVGMGGVGKTTLAQIVRKDPRVKKHFDLIMWICVSDNFDLVRITKEIIESATKKECNLSNLDTLRETLQNKLNSKRFLLVLDDVWSKDWQCLLAPMEGASEGSVVLVTTRSLECVDPGTSSINLEGLEDDIYWKFFKICTFGKVAQSNNFNVPDQLELIGKKICDKLKGSPLAAKTIGDVLGRNLDVEHWMKIKDSKIWQIQREENGILPVLQLSYQYLPSHLKKCFSFCSLYPKDFQFTQSELTKFWIMHGLIEPLNNFQQLITLADNYFHDLVRRCFFQLYNPNFETFNEYNKYVIHDLMHDVCQSITKDECFCLENGHSEQVLSPQIRHLSVFRTKLELMAPRELCGYKKLLSLKVEDTYCSHITAIKSWCHELTNIRSLFLANCKIRELPVNIGNLKHLQCLDISGTHVVTLPESFCNLYNLQYLNMNYCNDIKCFPKKSYNLVNLLLLCLPLEKVSLVKYIENMFQAIHFYDLVVDLRSLKIEVLKNIAKISGSVMIRNLERITSRETAEEAQLESKALIDSLHLYWEYRGHAGEGSGNNECHDEEVLGGLCPHPNLKILRISFYEGTDLSPSWLKEKPWPNLTKVFIWGCQKASTISYLPISLKHIEIGNCCELVSLPVESFGGFESLEWLVIESCPKLQSPNAMVLPPSVKILILSSCGDLENSIPSCLQNLTSLERLKIENCQRLVSIPVKVTNNLKYLSELIFENCSKLQSVGGLEFLASVQTVTIEDCPVLQETRGQNIKDNLPSGPPEDMPLSSQDRKRRTSWA